MGPSRSDLFRHAEKKFLWFFQMRLFLKTVCRNTHFVALVWQTAHVLAAIGCALRDYQ